MPEASLQSELGAPFTTDSLHTQKTKAHLSSVWEQDESHSLPKLKIEFEDTQDTQVLHDKLQNVNHVLTSNLQVCQDISNLLKQPSGVQSQGYPQTGDRRLCSLMFCHTETQLQVKRVQTLFQRINAASGLVFSLSLFDACERILTLHRCRISLLFADWKL